MPATPEPLTPFRRALRNVGWLLTGKGVAALLSLAYLALAARSLSVVEFGQFMLILSAAQAVAAIVGFQTWQVVIRFGVRHSGTLHSTGLGRLVRYCLALDFAGAIAGCGIAVVVIHIMQARLDWSADLAREALTFCFVLLLSVRSTAVGVLRLHDRFGLGALADSTTSITRFVGAAAAVFAGASVSGFLIAWAIAEIVTSSAYWLAVHRAAPGLIGRWAGAGATPDAHPGFWRFALATNANATMSTASRQLMVVLVGFVAGPVAAGGYRLAYQLSQSLVRLSDMFARGVFPELARADASATRDDLHRLFAQSSRLALVAGLAICILAPLLGQPVLWLIGGKAYLGAYPILVLLSLAAGLEVMAVGFEPLLLATGRAGQALRIRMISVALLAVLLLLFLPSYGVIMAGAAALASSALNLALFAQAARKSIAPSHPTGD